MKIKSTKLIAMLLAVCMMFSFSSVTFAKEADGRIDINGSAILEDLIKTSVCAYNVADVFGYLEIAADGVGIAVDAVELAKDYVEGYELDAELEGVRALMLEELKNTIETLGAVINLLGNDYTEDDSTDPEAALNVVIEDLLGMEGLLYMHLETLYDLACELGIVLDPYLTQLEDAITGYTEQLSQFKQDVYQNILNTVSDVEAKYAAFVEEMGAYADFVDPALGLAVRKFLTETPEDTFAILYVYGDKAVTKLENDAIVAYGEISLAVANLADVLYVYGTEIYETLAENKEVQALVAEINEMFDAVMDNELAIEDFLEAPFSNTLIFYFANIFGNEEALFNQYYPEIVKLYKEELKPVVCSAIEDVNPIAADALDEALDTLTTVLRISGDAAEGYLAWLCSHADAMGAALLAALIENLDELKDVACAVIKAYIEQFVAYIEQLCDEAIEKYEDLMAWYEEALYDATHAEYCVCGGEHNYVALGGMLTADGEVDKTYVDLFEEALEAGDAEVTVVNPEAEDMFLTAKNAVEYVNANAAAIAEADIVTYNMDVVGTVMDMVQEVLVGYYPGMFEAGYVDWSEYADAETIATAEEIVAEVYALLAEQYDAETVAAVGEIVEVLVYAIVSYGVETYEALETITAINPDALIVVVGMVNPFVGTTVSYNGEAVDLGEIFDYVIEATDLYGEFYAIFSEKVTFVSAAGAETIGAVDPVEIVIGQINITDLLFGLVDGAYLTEAGHADVCKALTEAIALDTIHEFGEWAVETPAQIGLPGLEVRECTVCGFVEERVIPALEVEIPDTPFIPPLYPEPEYVHFFCDGGENCHCHDFEDLDNTMWYHQGVCYMIEHALMIGIGDNKWGPKQVITRAEIATILWREAGSDEVDYELTFTDVEADMWYTEAIEWAVSEEIFLGYGDDTFGPNDQITREQMVTVIYRYEQAAGKTVTADFDMTTLSDSAEISEWAVDAMTWAFGCGLIIGTDVDVPTASPLKNASRSEVAMIFYRKLDNLLK